MSIPNYANNRFIGTDCFGCVVIDKGDKKQIWENYVYDLVYHIFLQKRSEIRMKTSNINLDSRHNRLGRQKALEAFQKSRILEKEQSEFILCLTDMRNPDMEEDRRKIEEYIKAIEDKRSELFEQFFGYVSYGEDNDFNLAYLDAMRMIWDAIICRNSILWYLSEWHYTPKNINETPSYLDTKRYLDDDKAVEMIKQLKAVETELADYIMDITCIGKRDINAVMALLPQHIRKFKEKERLYNIPYHDAVVSENSVVELEELNNIWHTIVYRISILQMIYEKSKN